MLLYKCTVPSNCYQWLSSHHKNTLPSPDLQGNRRLLPTLVTLTCAATAGRLPSVQGHRLTSWLCSASYCGIAITVSSKRTSANDDPLSPSSYVLSRQHRNTSCKLPVTEHPSVTSLSPHSSQCAITVSQCTDALPRLTSQRSIQHPYSLAVITFATQQRHPSSGHCYHRHSSTLIFNAQRVTTNLILPHTLVILTTDCRSVPLKDRHHHRHHSQCATVQHQQPSLLPSPTHSTIYS